MTLHRITPENARQIWGWFQERGGIAVWKSVNLSNPGASWTTPLRDSEGEIMQKQNWQMEEVPSVTIYDPAMVVVDIPEEVKRFHVAIRNTGMMFKCSDASSRRIRKAVEKAGENAWYEFDYGTQECVVYRPGKSIPLPEYVAETVPA